LSASINKQYSRKWDGMLQRTATGAALVAVSIGVVLVASYPIVLKIVTLVLSVAGTYELIRAAHLVQERGFLYGCIATAGIVSLLPIPRYPDLLPWILAAAVLVFSFIMQRNSRCILDTKPRTGGICLLTVLLLRSIPEYAFSEHGSCYLGFALLVCYATDAFAYLGGKAFGSHKLCPKISPNKTVEGSICGILGAVAINLALGLLLDVNTPLLLGYTICASVVGQFGDLAVSGVKRAFAVKDLGNILPGHGGILDRFDSHMFAVPFTLLFFRFTNGLF